MAYEDTRIGALRWVVTLQTIGQSPDGTTGVLSAPTASQDVHADIRPVGALTFWGGMQVDTAITHFVRVRWQPYVDNTHYVLRAVNLPDGTTRTETYHVRRVKELAGRHRFVELECEMEKSA